MADIKTIVKQMKDAGMNEADMLANLQELGIANPEEEMAKALQELKPIEEREPALSITKIDGEKEQTVDIKNMLESGIETNEELMKKVASTNLSNADEIEDKLDQVIALLKALQDINKKILETNRDLLLKMNKKMQEGEKPTLGKIF